MPAIANTTLVGPSDDTVFAPYGIDSKGVATLIAPGTSPVANRKLTVSSRTTPNGKTTTEIRLQYPVVQDVTVGGVVKPTVVRTAYAVISITTDQTSSHAEREELVTNMSSALIYDQNPTLVDMLIDSKPFY